MEPKGGGNVRKTGKSRLMVPILALIALVLFIAGLFIGS